MSDAPGDCPSGHVCFYEDSDYKNQVAKQNPPKDHCVQILPGFTSVYNNTDDEISVHDSAVECSGHKKKVPPHSGLPQLSYKSYSYKVTND